MALNQEAASLIHLFGYLTGVFNDYQPGLDLLATAGVELDESHDMARDLARVRGLDLPFVRWTDKSGC